MNYSTTYLSDYTVPSFFIKTVQLTFDIQEQYTIVTAESVFEPNKAFSKEANTLFLHGEQLELLTIIINDKMLTPEDYEVSPRGLLIHAVPDALFTLTCVTKIFPANNAALSGLFKTKAMYCTQCEAEGFRRMTFFLDRPDVMAVYTTKIMADKKRYPVLLSNGNLIETGDIDGNRHYATWHDPFKKPSYLFALVAGDFDKVTDEFITMQQRKVALEIYVEKGQGNKALHAMESVKLAMAWDEKAFGREYDLDVYMIVAASDFNMGAMENKGLNIFNAKYILADKQTATDDDYKMITSVIGHEYFHNWSGNRITCRDWFQLSLKEGLTIFRDQEFTADISSRAVKRIQDVRTLKTFQFAEDAGPMAHSVQPDSYMEINNFYTHTIYEKGAEIIRMMQSILGKEAFRLGMDLYFKENDGEAVTINEFVAAMEQASEIDLTQFKRWYKQIGTPTCAITTEFDQNKQTFSLTIEQTCTKTHDFAENPLVIPLRLELLNHHGQQYTLKSDEPLLHDHLLLLTDNRQTFNFYDITSEPLLIINQNFSAPVLIDYQYKTADLELIVEHSTDSYSRYDAMQQYFMHLFELLKNDRNEAEQQTVLASFVKLIAKLLASGIHDKAFLAELLTLPTERYLINLDNKVDIVAIHNARKRVIHAVANQLHDQFLAIYWNNQQTSDKQSLAEQAASRQLKNLTLQFLAIAENQQSVELSLTQYLSSQTMTERIVALQCLVNLQNKEARDCLKDFYDRFKQEDLVIDKWFSVQALSTHPDVFAEVVNLAKHPAFNIKNPNRLRSLLAVFSGNNCFHFHREDGQAYQFLADYVLQVDSFNPQIAARLVEPLISWQKFDATRSKLMQHELEKLRTKHHLSDDLFEVIDKSLM